MYILRDESLGAQYLDPGLTFTNVYVSDGYEPI
jgi:hypothetical protein